jgi:hypothetical protein
VASGQGHEAHVHVQMCALPHEHYVLGTYVVALALTVAWAVVRCCHTVCTRGATGGAGAASSALKRRCDSRFSSGAGLSKRARGVSGGWEQLVNCKNDLKSSADHSLSEMRRWVGAKRQRAARV